MENCVMKIDDEIIHGRNVEADNLVIEYHYSHYIPSNIQFCTSLLREGAFIASVFYSIPATRWSEVGILELCRLVRDEGVIPKPILTSLISHSIKEIKQSKKFDLLVSFADSTHQHHGGIYQASSWNYYTLRRPSHDGFIIEGKFIPRRTCNHRWGTSSRVKLPEILSKQGIDCIPHFDEGKYLYWKALTKGGELKANRLGLEKNPYPKPNKSTFDAR